VGWAFDRDEERVIGDPSTDRFAVAYLRSGQVTQLAVANSFIPVDRARTFIEARGEVADLAQMTAAG
jgi:hypothetical protein